MQPVQLVFSLHIICILARIYLIALCKTKSITEVISYPSNCVLLGINHSVLLMFRKIFSPAMFICYNIKQKNQNYYFYFSLYSAIMSTKC